MTAVMAGLLVLIVPSAALAQTTATLADLLPLLSLGGVRIGDAPAPSSSSEVPASDRGSSTDAARAPQPGQGEGQKVYTAEEATDPIPLNSQFNFQPTYQRRSGGRNNSYVTLKPRLVVQEPLPLLVRFDWDVPRVDNENGPTIAGIGDLQWTTLFLINPRPGPWGKLGIGPVFVFPTASHKEMGDGKYEIGPALGYVNLDVKGWQFALLVQQFFSFAGDSRRSTVNQLSLQYFIHKYLPDSWYIGTQPTITVNFEKDTSSVPLQLVVGKVFGGRWNVNLQATAFPHWTSKPTTDYQFTLSIGYQFPALFSRQ